MCIFVAGATSLAFPICIVGLVFFSPSRRLCISNPCKYSHRAVQEKALIENRSWKRGMILFDA